MGLLDAFLNKDKSHEQKDGKTISVPLSSSLVSDNDFNNSADEESALAIPCLMQGLSIICDTIASMPIYLYKEEDSFQQVYKNDPRSRALSSMANETLTSFNYKRVILKDLVLYGKAYSPIRELTEKSVILDYVPQNLVNPRKDGQGYYFEVNGYSTDVMGERFNKEVVNFGDMMVFLRNVKYNSISGQGLLDVAGDTIALSLSESNYLVNLFKNGLSAKAVLNSKSPFKKEIKEQLKRDLQEFYSGSKNAGKMLVLEGDISVLPLSITPTDAKIIESKKLTITDIARFLNIPKHMLNLDRGSATYSNITQERLQLLQNTLTPYTVILEECFNQKLLTEEEKEQGYYFQCDTSEMLKLTPEDQAKYMIDLFRENIVTIEEVRSTLNLGGSEDIIKELKIIQELKSNLYKKELTSSTTISEENSLENKQENKDINSDIDSDINSDNNSKNKA